MTTDEIMELAYDFAREYASEESECFTDKRQALESAIEALQADAARYEHLRNSKEALYGVIPREEWEPFGATVDLAAFPMGEDLDAAIDAAMALDKP